MYLCGCRLFLTDRASGSSRQNGRKRRFSRSGEGNGQSNIVGHERRTPSLYSSLPARCPVTICNTQWLKWSIKWCWGDADSEDCLLAVADWHTLTLFGLPISHLDARAIAATALECRADYSKRKFRTRGPQRRIVAPAQNPASPRPRLPQ